MKEIQYVSGLCGSGKTHSAIQYAIKLANAGHKILFVQKTKHLIHQTAKDIITLNSDVLVCQIHGDKSEQVVRDIKMHITSLKPGGEILLITHSGFYLTNWIRQSAWNVIWDELPQVDHFYEEKLPESHHVITDLIAADSDEVIAAIYPRIASKDSYQLNALAMNRHEDAVWDIFQPIAEKIISPHWKCYVHNQQFGKLIGRDNQSLRLQVFSLLQATLFDDFASVTIMGACFEQSLVRHVWAQQGVTFTPNTAIQCGLRYTTHQNGRSLTIRYVSDEPWSKRLRDQKMDDSRCVFDQVTDAIRAKISGSTDFVWMGNRDISDATFSGTRGIRLSNSPHGINCHQHINHAVVVSALNPTPAHFAFLDACGFDGLAVRRAGYWHDVYQAVMRTSLRNPNDRNPKTVTVMDRDTADWLGSLFPGSNVERLDGVSALPKKGKPGRPRRHADDATRTRAHRERFKAELRAALDEHARNYPMSQAAAGSVFADLKSRDSLATVELHTPDKFIAELRDMHTRFVPSKDEAGLISPATFDAFLSPDTNRGLANITSLWGIWLDNDGGDLSHQEFADLFPNLRMAVFNSWSSTHVQPRWRVFIPTTMMMPVAAYNAVTSQIVYVLNRHGYWTDKKIADCKRIKNGKRHGFDLSKLLASSLFYLPAQANAPDGSFFVDYAGPKRKPLNPYVWADYAADRAVPKPVRLPVNDNVLASSANKAAKPEVQNAAINEWRMAETGKGNDAFFRLGVGLAKSGMSAPDIAQNLNDEAAAARSPHDRKRQISGILKSLMNWRRNG